MADDTNATLSVLAPPQCLEVTTTFPANCVVAQARNSRGALIGYFAHPHDGTEHGMKESARSLRDALAFHLDDWSNINTRTGITGEEGRPVAVISPNGAHIAAVGTDDARYIFGDLDAGTGEEPTDESLAP